MTREEEFESLKTDFMMKNKSFVVFLESLHLEDFDKPVTRADMAISRLESTASYNVLVHFIMTPRRLNADTLPGL